jgi:hypothetical protein
MGKPKKAAGPAQGVLFNTTGAPHALRSSDRTVEYWHEFFDRLRATVDPSKLERALTMLRAERFQLFAEVHPDHVLGVVRSQSTAKRVYSCRLDEHGNYACCTQNLITCVVSRGSPCKHLLVLVLGLVNAGQLDPETALGWLDAACRRVVEPGANTPNKDLMAATFLRYKGVQTGEVDWRPTVTIPEDFYAV